MLRSFEPGDGTRYLYFIQQLTEAEETETGLSGFFFAFGPARAPLVAWVFRSNELPFLEFDYFRSKMISGRGSRHHEVLTPCDLFVGYQLFCALTEREPDEEADTPRDMSWRPDWKDQLPTPTPPLTFSPRERLILRVALSHAGSNVDEINDAFAPEDDEEDPDNEQGRIQVGDTYHPSLNEEEVFALHCQVTRTDLR